jgi:hypothetical protein
MDAAAPRMRPMSITDLVDAVFRVYRRHFLTFLGIVALLFVPMLLLQLTMTLAFGQAFFTDFLGLMAELPTFDPTTDSFSELSLGNVLAFYVISVGLSLLQGLIVMPLINGALTNAVAHDYHGQQTSMFGAYKLGGWRILWLLLGVMLVSFLSILLYMVPLGLFVGVLAFTGAAISASGEGGGALLGVLLMILFFFGLIVVLLAAALISLCFAFVIPVIIIERRDPISAIGRSWKLVTSIFWRVLGVAVILFLLSLVFQAMAIVLGIFIGSIFDPFTQYAMSQALGQIVDYGISMLLIPLFMITYTLLYFDARIRKEGYDLQMQMQQSGSSSDYAEHYA